MITELMYELLKRKPYKTKVIRYGRHALKVEIADNFAKLAVGLMYRNGLGRDAGMLFILKSESFTRATITMLNMRFAIDIIWLDKNGHVVDMVANAPPTSSIFTRPYAPKSRAKYVLELGSGQIKRLKIKENGRFVLS